LTDCAVNMLVWITSTKLRRDVENNQFDVRSSCRLMSNHGSLGTHMQMTLRPIYREAL